jgi:hypothetical protein
MVLHSSKDLTTNTVRLAGWKHLVHFNLICVMCQRCECGYAQFPCMTLTYYLKSKWKARVSMKNTQQVQYRTMGTWIIEQHWNFTQKHRIYRKNWAMGVRQYWLGIYQRVGSEFTNPPQSWLGVYQPAVVLARNLPTYNPFRRKYWIGEMPSRNQAL